MAVSVGFRVGVDGSDFCNNAKKHFYIYVDLLRDRTVEDIENRIKCMLKINTSVYLMNGGYYLPSMENVRLLSPGDILKIVKQIEEDVIDSNELLTDNIKNHEQTKEKKKKKRKHESSKNESHRTDDGENHGKQKMKKHVPISFEQNNIQHLTLSGIERLEIQHIPNPNNCKENSEEEIVATNEDVNLSKKAINRNYADMYNEQRYMLEDAKPKEREEKKTKLINFQENLAIDVQRNKSFKHSKNEGVTVNYLSHREENELDQLTFKENEPELLDASLDYDNYSSKNMGTSSKMAADKNDIPIEFNIIEKSNKRRRLRVRKHKKKKNLTFDNPSLCLPKIKKESFLPNASVKCKHIWFEEEEEKNEEEEEEKAALSAENDNINNGNTNMENGLSDETKNIFGNISTKLEIGLSDKSKNFYGNITTTKWDMKDISGHSSNVDQFNRLLSFEHSSIPLICERRKSKSESISQHGMNNEEDKKDSSIKCNGDDIPKKNGEIPTYQGAENIDPSKYPKITEMPKPGDFVAFKILKMDENYTPQISELISAKILETSKEISQLTLLVVGGHDQCRQPNGKFSLGEDDEFENKLSINWNEMIDPRLLFP
ncbi:hypothetical protein C0J52_17285 [Blattella germanica]|nr:hypothetical protein C0J52_17285 [Blattella germanica]